MEAERKPLSKYSCLVRSYEIVFAVFVILSAIGYVARRYAVGSSDDLQCIVLSMLPLLMTILRVWFATALHCSQRTGSERISGIVLFLTFGLGFAVVVNALTDMASVVQTVNSTLSSDNATSSQHIGPTRHDWLNTILSSAPFTSITGILVLGYVSLIVASIIPYLPKKIWCCGIPRVTSVNAIDATVCISLCVLAIVICSFWRSMIDGRWDAGFVMALYLLLPGIYMWRVGAWDPNVTTLRRCCARVGGAVLLIGEMFFCLMVLQETRISLWSTTVTRACIAIGLHFTTLSIIVPPQTIWTSDTEQAQVKQPLTTAAPAEPETFVVEDDVPGSDLNRVNKSE